MGLMHQHIEQGIGFNFRFLSQKQAILSYEIRNHDALPKMIIKSVHGRIENAHQHLLRLIKDKLVVCIISHKPKKWIPHSKKLEVAPIDDKNKGKQLI